MLSHDTNNDGAAVDDAAVACGARTHGLGVAGEGEEAEPLGSALVEDYLGLSALEALMPC